MARNTGSDPPKRKSGSAQGAAPSISPTPRAARDNRNRKPGQDRAAALRAAHAFLSPRRPQP
jgi:hypothetical protein